MPLLFITDYIHSISAEDITKMGRKSITVYSRSETTPINDGVTIMKTG
jgi:hypothetical protein